MPDVPAVAALLLALLAGLVAGWLIRGLRTRREKAALSAGWQHQLDAQQSENDRIAAQNTSLMEQVSQLQAANVELRKRGERLSGEAREATTAREGLARQVRDLRASLGAAVAQRDRLRAAASDDAQRGEAVSSRLREKDEKIAQLRLELGRWQERVPPLVERYRERDAEAQALAQQVDELRARLATGAGSDETRIEPLEDAAIAAGDASNEQYEDTLLSELRGSGDYPADAPADSAGRPDDAADAARRADGGHDREEPPREREETRHEQRDDLKRIRGIGPAIEKTLNRLGILRLRQIADMSQDDVARVAGELRGFRSRIEREDWIGQARLLLAEGARDPV